jgi:BirA family biotin operon repressor/biotin-[acetyl-CoA-carboxylase] ligase
MTVDLTARAAEGRHIAYDTVGSTNAEALKLARAGERGPYWVTARSQSAGRGRRGRDWTSPPGNLYATLLLSEPSPPAVAAQLSFVAGLAVHDAIVACAPPAAAVTLKWPNDVLIGGAKLAGILIEAESEPVYSAAIGIGINCMSHPEETAYPATDLAEQGATSDVAAVFGCVIAAMAERLAQWRSGAGFARIRADWLAQAAGLDQPIVVRLPECELSGIFTGLDADGRLLLRSASGAIEAITAGDVFGLASGSGAAS